MNNAGVPGAIGRTDWLTRADYERCLSVNLYGVIDVTRIFLPLVRRGKGRVVNISSMMGRIAAATAPYVVSKYGVEGFTDCLRFVYLQRYIYRRYLSLDDTSIFTWCMCLNSPYRQYSLGAEYDMAEIQMQRLVKSYVICNDSLPGDDKDVEQIFRKIYI